MVQRALRSTSEGHWGLYVTETQLDWLGPEGHVWFHGTDSPATLGRLSRGVPSVACDALAFPSSVLRFHPQTGRSEMLMAALDPTAALDSRGLALEEVNS